MLARLLALFLVFAWFDLAALDLLEDLNGASGDGAYTQGSKYYPRGLNRHASLTLTNNIVESALSSRAGAAAVLRLGSACSELHTLSSCYRALDLHKLHRVFLI
jgi:hypothetical protein